MIRLTRSVVVSSFDAEATVAVSRDRPEFLAVAQLAADLGRPLGAQDVLRELFGRRPEVLGWRVIERCVALGLLERSGAGRDATLSDAGRLALEHNAVLVPEEGIWRFFVVHDPLVPSAIVHAERLESEPVWKERGAAKAARARSERPSQADHLPELLRSWSGGLPHKSFQSGHLFQLCELAERGVAGPSGKLQLTFTWTDQPSIQVMGHLPLDRPGGSEPMDTSIPLPEVLAPLSRERLWRALVTQATRVSAPELERWQATAGGLVVPVAFSSLDVAARHRCCHDIEVPASDLMGLGRFDATILNDVHLVPASEADAQAWLTWLQWEAINDYVTPTLLEELGRKESSRFPHHRPRALSAPELLSKARADRDERAWFLLGPSDLGLWS
jgi:hypothetical protein